jgi:hypothetical protein
MMGTKSFMALIEDDTAQTEGNIDVLEQLASAMIEFDLFFEILPGTNSLSVSADLNNFEVGQMSQPHE